MTETNTIKREYKYMVEDIITKDHYLLTESEREFLVKRISRGYKYDLEI